MALQTNTAQLQLMRGLLMLAQSVLIVGALSILKSETQINIVSWLSKSNIIIGYWYLSS